MKRLALILMALILLACAGCSAGIPGTKLHKNTDGSLERNYQKDINRIYVKQYSLETSLPYGKIYKIDLKNQAFFSGDFTEDTDSAQWGIGDGAADQGFTLVSSLEGARIDTFFRESARYGFTSWEAEYRNDDIADGSGWLVKILFSDGSVQEAIGINAYPETWEDMGAAFQNLTGTDFLSIIDWP